MNIAKFLISKTGVKVIFFFSLFLMALDWYFNQRTIEEVLIHIWPELIIAVLIYYILDDGLRKYFEVPTDRVQTSIKDLVSLIRNSKNEEILIMDTSILSFFDKQHNFKGAVIKAIESNSKIKILLLHPDTDAAQQRADDLNKKGNKKINFRKEMRQGLRLLYKAVEEAKVHFGNNWDEGAIQTKLYKSTPTMTLVSNNERGFFNILPAYDYDSNENKIITTMTTPFGNYLRSKFNAIWNAKGEDAKKVIDFSEFFYCEIHNKNNKQAWCKEVIWGGSDEERFLPRYLMINSTKEDYQSKHDSLKNEIEKFPNLPMTLNHSKRIFDVTVEKIHKYLHDSDEVGKTEYMMALLKISRTYGWDPEKNKEEAGRTIYEIKYARERFNIQTDAHEISANVNNPNMGYEFVSHRKLDIDISNRFLDHWKILNECFDQLPEDKYDIEANEIRKNKNIVPRKRILCLYDLVCDNGQLTIIRNDNDSTYPGTFTIKEEDKEIKIYENKELDGITKLSKYNVLEVTQKQKFDDFLESIIKFDFENLLPAGSNDLKSSKWIVYFHMMRLEVKENERCQAKAEIKDQDQNNIYQAVHLVQRFNVADGMTFIIDGNNHDYILPKDAKETYSLQKPLDTIYINRHHVKFDVSDVRFYATEKTKRSSGKRDTLILEFRNISS